MIAHWLLLYTKQMVRFWSYNILCASGSWKKNPSTSVSIVSNSRVVAQNWSTFTSWNIISLSQMKPLQSIWKFVWKIYDRIKRCKIAFQFWQLAEFAIQFLLLCTPNYVHCTHFTWIVPFIRTIYREKNMENMKLKPVPLKFKLF